MDNTLLHAIREIILQRYGVDIELSKKIFLLKIMHLFSFIMSQDNMLDAMTYALSSLSKERKKALIAISSNNKNAAAVGFMGKMSGIN